MNISCKRILHFAILISISAYALGQHPLWKTERERNEKERKKLDSLNIYEVKAYQYLYSGGKKSNDAILAEHKIFNPKGYVKYEYSTIDPELSYIFAQKCILNTQYSEDMLTDGGLYNASVVTGNFEDLYMLPSVIRYYYYNKDTLVKMMEAYPFEGDTSIAGITYAYNVNNYPSVQENVLITSKNWLISTVRDLYLNSTIAVGQGGPWLYTYNAIYYFNKNNEVTSIVGTHVSRNFSKQYIFDKQGRIEKTFGYFNNSFKVINKHVFEYDAQNNVIFADIDDVPGHIQIRKKYDQNKNIIEYERIQVEEIKKMPGLADARYLHCFYKYDPNGLLKERIDLGKTKDTIATISYVYRLDNDHTQEIAEKVEAKLKVWKVKGKYESTQEYTARTSEANIKKQSEIYRKEAIDEIGQERYNVVPVSMDYNADTECFTLKFEELDVLYLFVPRGEAEAFENNIGKYTIYPHFEEGKDGRLILKSCILKSTETGKEYKSVEKRQ